MYLLYWGAIIWVNRRWKNKFRNMLIPILNLFFSKYVQHISLTYFVVYCCVPNSVTRGSDRFLSLLFDAKTLVVKMVKSPPSPPAASSPQFNAASAVPPARMSLSRCLSSDGTINIEKYRLYSSPRLLCFGGVCRSQWIVFLSMVAAPPPTTKKKHAPRGVLARKDTEDGPLEIILPVDSLWYKAYVSNFFDARTGIIHGEEIL